MYTCIYIERERIHNMYVTMFIYAVIHVCMYIYIYTHIYIYIYIEREKERD